MSKSQAELVAELSPEQREEIFKDFTEKEFEALQHDWGFWGRPEQTPPEGDWHIFLALAGRGWGKCTTVYTMIPTPSGWVKMGDLVAGDYVFDEKGEPTKVVQAFTPYIPNKMFKLTFSDGTEIECGEDHLWTTWTARDRKSYNRRNDYISSDASVGVPDNWPTWTKENKNGTTSANSIGPKTRTTQEIADTFRYGKRGDLNHSIPVVTGPLQYPERALPVDPYVYGCWLGDGAVDSSTITSHVNEIEWLSSEIESRGYSTRIGPEQFERNCKTLTVLGLRKNLREAGSLQNKDFNEEYLLGSEQQRRDLLAGLLDTDGYVNPDNQQVEFCAKRKEHADAVVELARSLGQKPVLIEGRATLYGVDHGTKYRVKWRATENFFYMPRKAAIFKPLDAQASRNMHRMITNIEEIEPVLSRCIAVENPNHLFLCGEGMIPTHNSRAGAEWIRARVKENPGCKILLLGRTAADARDVMVSAILECSPEGEKPEFIPSKRRLEWPNGSYALITSSESPDQLRGPQAHFGWADEVAALKAIVDDSGATAWSNLLTAVRLGKNPQIFGTTTPKRTPLMKKLVADAKDPKKRIRIVRGSTFDNSNLSDLYIEGMVSSYGDSDLGKQELYGEMLDDQEGLFFTQAMIEDALKIENQLVGLPPLRFIAVDPSVAQQPRDECGIIAIGATAQTDPSKRTAYIMEDFSICASPDIWAQRVVDAAKLYKTRFVVVEKNQGGQLIQMAINAIDPDLKVFNVYATKGKQLRAEPVVVAMQQHRVKFMEQFPELFDQLLFWNPEDSSYSPDRLDAFVWGVVASLISPPDGLRVSYISTTSSMGRRLPEDIGTGRRTSAISRPQQRMKRVTRGRGQVRRIQGPI